MNTSFQICLFALLIFCSCSRKLNSSDAKQIANDLYDKEEYQACIEFIENYMSKKNKKDTGYEFYLDNLKMNSAYNIGKYRKCLNYLNEMINKYSDKSTELISRKAESYYELQMYDSAIYFYSVSLASAPNAIYLSNRGLCFLKIGDINNAIQDFDLAISIDSTTHFAYNGKALAMGKIKDYDKALFFYNKAISYEKNYVYLCNRGILYLKMNIPQKGLIDLNESLNLNPEYALAIGNKGYAFELLGNLDSACSYYKRAALKGDEDAIYQFKKVCR